MHATNVDDMIVNFLERKDVKFPELGLSARHESRTIKYAIPAAR